MWDITRLHELIERFARNNQLPAFLTGGIVAILVSLGSWQLLAKLRPSKRDQIDELGRENDDLKNRLGAAVRERELLQQRNDELGGQRTALKGQAAEMSESCERLKTENFDLTGRLKKERRLHRDAEARAAGLDAQLRGLLDADLKIWDRPVVGQIPPFVPLTLRKTPILAVVNLKGGVGKTTLTANLGAAFASNGQRVLMIDLDYQGSLSSLCLSFQESEDVQRGDRYIHEVFRDDVADPAQALVQQATRLQQVPGQAFLVAAGEEFERVEMNLMMRWHLGATGDDVRYRLREALHASAIVERFDLVLLDCPPRLTTGCINALTACDSVLVPVLLDSRSAEAAPRLFRWLRLLRPTACPELSIMGVVGNKSIRQLLVARERAVWEKLKDQCREAWGEPVRHFDEAIVLDHPSPSDRFAALCPKYRDRYLELTDLIFKELPAHARRRVPAVPAVATLAAPRVRG